MHRNDINIFEIVEIANQIFSHLPRSTLLKVATVCKQWLTIAHQGLFWAIQEDGKIIISDKQEFMSRIKTSDLLPFMKTYIMDLGLSPETNAMLSKLFPDLALTFDLSRHEASRKLYPHISSKHLKVLASSMTAAAMSLQLLPDRATIINYTPDEIDHALDTLKVLKGSFDNFSNFSVLTDQLLTFNQAVLLHRKERRGYAQSKLECLVNEHHFKTLTIFKQKKIPIEKVITNLSEEAIETLTSICGNHRQKIFEEDLITIDEAKNLTGNQIIYLSSYEGIGALKNEFTCLSRNDILALDETWMLLLLYCDGIRLIENKKITLEELKQKHDLFDFYQLYRNYSSAPRILFNIIDQGLLSWEELEEVHQKVPAKFFSPGIAYALKQKCLTMNKIRELVKRDNYKFFDILANDEFSGALSFLLRQDEPTPAPVVTPPNTTPVSIVPSSVFSPKPVSGNEPHAEQKCIIDQSFELF